MIQQIVNTRRLAYLSGQIALSQAGLVKGRVLVSRAISYIASDYQENQRDNRTVYICFVDFCKAFDTVIWSHLSKILAKMGVPPHLILLFLFNPFFPL